MTGHRPLSPSIALTLLVISLTAGCSNTNDPPTATRTRAKASSSSATTNTPTALTTAVPAQVSDFPDGVYRSQLTLKRLQEVGMDDTSYAGTWTLTARSGNYRLECRAIANPTRRPARAYALEAVRTTTRRGYAARSPTSDVPTNSA